MTYLINKDGKIACPIAVSTYMTQHRIIIKTLSRKIRLLERNGENINFHEIYNLLGKIAVDIEYFLFCKKKNR